MATHCLTIARRRQNEIDEAQVLWVFKERNV